MSQVDITIAIPVYNVEKYVERSILSALEQRFDGRYEVLVIDDRGSDNSMQIVHSLQKEHPNGNKLRIIEHKKNRGLGEASNTAIDNAQGKYLLFLDSDDWLEANALHCLYSKAENYNAEVVIGSYKEVHEDGSEGKVIRYKDRFLYGSHALINDYMHHHNAPNIHRWNKLFRLDFLRNNHIRCEHRIMEDSIFDFNVRALASRVCLMSDITLTYNIRQGSIMTSIQNQEGKTEYAEVYADIIKKVQKLIINRYSTIDGIYDYYYLRLYASILQLLNARYSSEQKMIFEEVAKGCNDIIPSWRNLYHSRYRFVYLWCKLKHKQDCDTFIQGYEYSRTTWGYLCRVGLKLIPVAKL